MEVVLTFDVGGLACAVAVSQVREVLEPRPVTHVPGAPAAAAAVFALRGGIVTVVDLALRLGLGPSGGRPEWIVVDGPDGVGACALRTGGAAGLVTIDAAALARPRGLGAAAALLRGVHLLPEGPLLVLDLERILDPDTVRRARVAASSRPSRPPPSSTAADRSAPAAPPRGEAEPGAAACGVASEPRPSASEAPREPPRAAPAPTVAAPLPAPPRVEKVAFVPGARSWAPIPRRAAEALVARPPPGPGPQLADVRASAPDTGPRQPAGSPRRPRAAALAASALAAALLALALRWSSAPTPTPTPPWAGHPERSEAAPAAKRSRGTPTSTPPWAGHPEPFDSAAYGRYAQDRLREAAPAAKRSRGTPTLVPAPNPVPPTPEGFVVVVRGDTLWRLAGTHLGAPTAWPRLHAANRDAIPDPDRIAPGQRLAVPSGR